MKESTSNGSNASRDRHGRRLLLARMGDGRLGHPPRAARVGRLLATPNHRNRHRRGGQPQPVAPLRHRPAQTDKIRTYCRFAGATMSHALPEGGPGPALGSLAVRNAPGGSRGRPRAVARLGRVAYTDPTRALIWYRWRSRQSVSAWPLIGLGAAPAGRPPVDPDARLRSSTDPRCSCRRGSVLYRPWQSSARRT